MKWMPLNKQQNLQYLPVYRIKKKIVSFILLCACVLCFVGCGEKVNQNEKMPETTTTEMDESQTDSEEMDSNSTGEMPNLNNDEKAIANGPYGSIQLSIPDTWEYKICDVDSDKLVLALYGIHIKPVMESEGFIEIGYTENFGVCGTGLERKNITLANREASIGYYDGNDNWSFINWLEPDGILENITILNCAEWGTAYMDDIIKIIDSLQYEPGKR